MENTFKYIQIAEALKRRIAQGDYEINALPGAKSLAEELGCNHLTVRQAIKKLIADGLIARGKTRRLKIQKRRGAEKPLKVAYIRPAWDFLMWDVLIHQEAIKRGGSFKMLVYGHDDDPGIFEALNGDFDIIFIYSIRSDQIFIDKLKRKSDKVVSLFNDLTSHGIRYLDGIGMSAIQTLLDHLHSLGHRKIDCFNTQPEACAIAERIRQWKAGLERLGIKGCLFNSPAPSFSPAYMRAYDEMNKLVKSGRMGATAIFCPQVDCATGAIRALHDNGWAIPSDISICTFGDSEKASIFIPSICTIDAPDTYAGIKMVFDSVQEGRRGKTKLRFLPEGLPAIRGESAGEARQGETSIRAEKRR